MEFTENNTDIYRHTLTEESLLSYLQEKAAAAGYRPPIFETTLLRHFFPAYEKIMRSGDSLALFKIHFILYHHLYRLKLSIAPEPYVLHIHLASIYFLPYPEQSRCPYFDEVKPGMCLNHKVPADAYCGFHTELHRRLGQANIVAARPLDNYYLNQENLTAMGKDELEYMLSTWQAICSSPEELLQCYEELELEPGADLKTITGRYHSLARRYHPDVNADPRAHTKMYRINHAYQVLKERIGK